MHTNEKEPILNKEEIVEEMGNDNLADNEAKNDELSNEDTNTTTTDEVAEWKDKYMRLFAEFDNYKKRSFKEKMETIQTAGKDILISLLDVLDDMERAKIQISKSDDVKAVNEGLELVFHKLKTTLEAKGLKAFDAKNEEFDVEKHEAVTEIPVSDKAMEGKVVDELQKGYFLNDKIIRYAKVVVGKTSN
ncbi:MAG: nucleotide exchange factor GrpE [Chitinophagaceae bacterium]